ncbi:MAG TPA: endonuclease [Candidatus Competibacteraceae bacterium]|nr:endonuclease [Candidatus Competibacteraceae bacterium]
MANRRKPSSRRRAASRSFRSKGLALLVALVLGSLGYLGFHLPPQLQALLPAELRQYLPRDGRGGSTVAVNPGDLPSTARSFSGAKSLLYQEVYADHRKTFYCGCDYDENLNVDLDGCGLGALKNISRARRVEAEHIFPAAQFGNFRQCWREPEAFAECRKPNGKTLSGRQCCEEVDPLFRAAHNDLMNLYPVVGEVNAQRKDYNWGMVPGEKREFGRCNIEVEADIRRAEPPESVMGDIARTMLYMEATYGFRLSDQDRQLFTAWNRQDPPDAWEQERNRRIARIQGRGNRFIERWPGQ